MEKARWRHGFAAAFAALALVSAILIVLGIYLLPRPPYPTYAEAARLCGNCSRVSVSLQLEEMMSDYGRMTFVPRSLAQLGVGALVAAPVAVLLHSRKEGLLRAGNGTARTWGEWILAAGLSVFLVVGVADIFYANTGDKSSFAFLAISFVESNFGNQSFGELGAVALAVAGAGATVFAGVRNAVLRAVAPAAFAFSVGLLLFDWKEISIHAADFLSGVAVNHTDLVSNWSLLAASGVLALAGALGAVKDSIAGPDEKAVPAAN